MDNEPKIEHEPFLREFMNRHNITEDQMSEAAEAINRDRQPAKRPPERLNIPTRPAHLPTFYDFCGGKGGKEERDER